MKNNSIILAYLSAIISFFLLSPSLIAAQPYSYCSSRANKSTDEWIKQIVIGTIKNFSTGDKYQDFSGMNTTAQIGGSVALSLIPGFRSSSYPEDWSIFIDLNRNGLFTDAGERVFNQRANTTINGTFAVPLSASVGPTRMRVSMRYNQQAEPCGTFTWGEVEDYSVTLVSSGIPPTPQPFCTPPQCSPPNSLACGAASCPGGCGTICATPTPVPTVTNPTFVTQLIDVPSSSMDVKIGKLNSDLHLDFAASSNISVFNSLDGTGFSPSNYNLPSPSRSRAIDLGDINSDGALDIVSANQFSQDLSVLMNTSPLGKFGWAMPLSLGNPSVNLGKYQDVKLIDLNLDGKLDILALDQQTGKLSRILNQSNSSGIPSFKSPLFNSVNNGTSMAVGKFNADQYPDVAMSTGSLRKVLIYTNILGQAFNPGIEILSPGDVDAIVTADFDMDGLLDLAFSSRSPSVNEIRILFGGSGFSPSSAKIIPLNNYEIVRDLIAVDLNCDNKVDLMTLQYGYSPVVQTVINSFLNNSGNFITAPAITYPAAPGFAIAAGSRNPAKPFDGHMMVATINSYRSPPNLVSDKVMVIRNTTPACIAASSVQPAGQ